MAIHVNIINTAYKDCRTHFLLPFSGADWIAVECFPCNSASQCPDRSGPLPPERCRRARCNSCTWERGRTPLQAKEFWPPWTAEDGDEAPRGIRPGAPPPSPPSSLPTHLPCCQKTRRRRETRSACYHDTLRDSREHYGYLRDSTSLYGRCRILRLDTRLRGTAQHGRIYEYEPMRNATRQQRQPGLFWILSISRSPWNNQPDICF